MKGKAVTLRIVSATAMTLLVSTYALLVGLIIWAVLQ